MNEIIKSLIKVFYIYSFSLKNNNLLTKNNTNIIYMTKTNLNQPVTFCCAVLM